jgi:hypothetical protein
MNEQEMRDLFREMREEPVPADSLARVRASVDRRIARRNWWKLAIPLAVTGCIVAAFLMLRPAKTPVRTPVRAIEVVQPEIAEVIPPPEAPVRTVSRPRRFRPRPGPIEGAPVLIRIETPDPEVVILLVN